jgi:hypothetical protein
MTKKERGEKEGRKKLSPPSLYSTCYVERINSYRLHPLLSPIEIAAFIITGITVFLLETQPCFTHIHISSHDGRDNARGRQYFRRPILPAACFANEAHQRVSSCCFTREAAAACTLATGGRYCLLTFDGFVLCFGTTQKKFSIYLVRARLAASSSSSTFFHHTLCHHYMHVLVALIWILWHHSDALRCVALRHLSHLPGVGDDLLARRLVLDHALPAHRGVAAQVDPFGKQTLKPGGFGFKLWVRGNFETRMDITS